MRLGNFIDRDYFHYASPNVHADDLEGLPVLRGRANRVELKTECLARLVVQQASPTISSVSDCGLSKEHRTGTGEGFYRL